MKEDKSIFLKVDYVEPAYKCCGFSPYGATPLDGIKVWIGNNGHFFECNQYTICDPDAVREDGRRQAVALMNELTTMMMADNKKLFGYVTARDILTHFSYDEIVEKLDAWKKEKEAIIRVRDEVYHQSMQVKFVVTRIIIPSGGEDAIVNGLKKDGTAVKGLLLCNLEKTGLHVGDLDAYLEV